MRQAIFTKYLGPTNHRGARVKAMAQAGSVIIPWDDALDPDQNHRNAALALINRFNWLGRFALKAGGLPDGRGNSYILVPLESSGPYCLGPGRTIQDAWEAELPEMPLCAIKREQLSPYETDELAKRIIRALNILEMLEGDEL